MFDNIKSDFWGFLRGELFEFCKTLPADTIHADPTNPGIAYTDSAQYLINTTIWHCDHTVDTFLHSSLQHFKPDNTILDVGCMSGYTGLFYAWKGQRVTLHDFDGLALDWLRWLGERHGESIRAVPYGQPVERHDWVVALDVLEHTGNHLGFLHWLESLGRTAIITYPLMPFEPPYKPVIDAWVDDEAINQIIGNRYDVIYSRLENGRRYLVYRMDGRG